MGRVRKYATEEEAKEAKKKQMRENYQKKKAEREKLKQEAIEKGEELPKPPPRTRKYLTWNDIPKIFKMFMDIAHDIATEEEEENIDNIPEELPPIPENLTK